MALIAKTSTEDEIHKAIWAYLSGALPDDVLCWSVENRRNGAREGHERKLRGCVAGVPDIHLVYRGRWLGIELKAPGRNRSAVQLEWARKAEMAGAAPVAEARSIKDVMDILKIWGIPTIQAEPQ